MRIALDATYSVDQHPTGIGIYSQNILTGLADAYPGDEFLWCYRPKQFLQSARENRNNVRRKLLLPPAPAFRADLFHALNQRVDRRPAKKVVSTFHDLFVMTEDYSTPDFRARFTRQARVAAHNSDLIITVSRFTAGQVSELLQFPGSRIRVVPHGVRPPSSVPEKPREHIVLFTGVLQARKNIIRLVEAFERVLPLLLDDWQLILAGACTGYGAQSILDRIARSASKDRIQVLGYVPPDGLNALYARASIFAFPSLNEGFGIPVLEAMANGVPVIASNRPALAEVAGDAAALVDPCCVDELAAALQRFMASPALREEYGGKGRERAKTYSWERSVEGTYAVYRELIP